MKRFLRSRVSSRRRPLRQAAGALFAATLLTGGQYVHADNLQWDPTNMGNPPDGGSNTWDLTSTYWYNNQADVVWTNSGTDIANFTTTNAGTVTTTAAIQVNQMIFGTGGYTIANGAAGTLTLSGTTPTINVGAGLTDTVSAAMGGTAGFTKTGTGTLVLSGANTYTGATLVNAGTLMLTSAGKLGATSATVTNPTVTFTGSSTVDLGGANRTWAAITSTGAAAQTDVITNGSLQLGSVNFAFNPANASGTTTTLNLSGLTSFNYTQAAAGQTFVLNAAAGSNTTNQVDNLSATTNAITATSVTIGAGSGGATGGTATVNLGATNTLNADTVQLGGYRGAGGTLQFTTGTTNSALTLRGAAGGTTPVADVVIGLQQAGGAGGANNSVLDTSTGSINAIVNRLSVFIQGTASAAPAGTGGVATQSGTFSFANGTVNTGTLSLGSTNQGNTTVNSVTATTIAATVNQNAGALLSDAIIFGNNANNYALAAGTTSVGNAQGNINYQSTYNLGTATTAGILSAASIAPGSASSTASRSTLNFNNGTITNYDNTANGFLGQGNANGSTSTNQQNLTLAGRVGGGTAVNSNTLNIVLAGTAAHNFLAETGFTITQANTSLITGTGALTANGAGTVILQGNNTYSGGTNVTAGMLTVAANGALGMGNINLSASTTLTINAGVTITNMTGTTLTLANNTSLVNLLGTTGTVQDTVNLLVINGVTEPAGTYGSNTSGAPAANQLADFTGSGELVVLTGSAVPEPGTWTLLGLGSVCVLGTALRRHARRA